MRRTAIYSIHRPSLKTKQTNPSEIMQYIDADQILERDYLQVAKDFGRRVQATWQMSKLQT